MNVRAPALAIALATMLGACGDTSEPSNDISMVRPLEDTNMSTAIPNAVAVEGVAGEIPARFRGTYAEDAADCDNAATVFRLVVEPNRLRFHESMGDVRAVTVEGANAIRIAVDYSGEGMEWSTSQRMALSEGDARLTITGEGEPFTRERC